MHYKYNFYIAEKFKKYSSLIFTVYMIFFILLNIFVSAESNYFALFMILTTIITLRMIEYGKIAKYKRSKYDGFTKAFAEISYEIYLVQYPVIFFMQRLQVNEFIKIILICIITFVASLLLHLFLNCRFKSKILKSIKAIALVGIIVTGLYIVIAEKDTRAEMESLEEALSDNTKIVEEKNKEFENSIEQENKEDESLENSLKENTKSEEEIAEIVRNLPVVGIGDSVLLDAINELYKKFPNGYYDGKVSRSLSASLSILKDLKSSGKLSNTLILSLANNGDYLIKKNKELMEIVEDRDVYWVNAVGADDLNFNDKFAEFAKDYSNIHLVEWDKVAEGHSEYFYPDKIHPNSRGNVEYANTIYEAVYKDYLKKYQDNEDL